MISSIDFRRDTDLDSIMSSSQFRTLPEYFFHRLRNNVTHFAKLVVNLGPLALPVPLIFLSTKYGALGMLAFVGVVGYIGALDRRETDEETGDEHSSLFEMAIGIVLFAYFNWIIIFAVSIGHFTVQSGHPTLGTLLAIAIPAIDGELSRIDKNPFSFARLMIDIPVLIGLIIKQVSDQVWQEVGNIFEELKESEGITSESIRRIRKGDHQLP